MIRDVFLVSSALLCLSGCAEKAVAPTQKLSPSATESAALERLPSELSIPHFRSMTLSGTALRLERVMEEHDTYTKYAISYQSNGLKITGVFLLPHGDGPFPLLIFNHGYIDPKIYTQGRGPKREENYMAQQGFAVLHPDYRGHAGSDPSPMTENVYDGNLEYAMDSANAILAAREANLPSVDTEHVGMLGHSLGGGVTLAILTGKPDLVRAAVLYAPVHANVYENFARWRAKRDEGDRTLTQFGTPESNPKAWEGLSPLTFLGDITAPVLLVQGSADKDVPKAWSDFLAQKLKENGKDVMYVEYEGEGHEFSFKWLDFMQNVSDFFRRELVKNDWVAPLSPSRITKKPFGIHVDPEHSPVTPEKFRGFHTGTDYETEPGEADVEIRAACTGNIVYKQSVKGYGGVLIQRCSLNGESVTALYGHLRLASITKKVGETLSAGEPFALLGRGFSAETDGERQHLHFGVHRGGGIELKGYVQTQEELHEWVTNVW